MMNDQQLEDEANARVGAWPTDLFEPGLFGLTVGRTYDGSPRSVISKEITFTAGGNVVLRVGRENENGQGWHKTEHVIMPPDEAIALAETLTLAAKAAQS